MRPFSIRQFFKNIRYLGCTNLKQINNLLLRSDDFVTESQFNDGLDNLIYELPYLIDASQKIKKPYIYNFDETINTLLNTNKSLIRFGDGEVLLMNNQSIGFQKTETVLSNRLKEIIQSDEPNIMIAINYHYYYADLLNFLDYPKFVYRTYMNKVRERLEKYLVPNKQYYSAGFTSCYQIFKEYDFLKSFNKLRSIWNDINITIICGDKTFQNIEYNIFDNAKTINYIYAPFNNAYEKYDLILDQAKLTDKKQLIVVMLGPTAKLLCFDLTRMGYRTLDLGHIAKDYNEFMKSNVRDKNSISRFYEN